MIKFVFVIEDGVIWSRPLDKVKDEIYYETHEEALEALKVK